jgi:hypothetical protein
MVFSTYFSDIRNNCILRDKIHYLIFQCHTRQDHKKLRRNLLLAFEDLITLPISQEYYFSFHNYIFPISLAKDPDYVH